MNDLVLVEPRELTPDEVRDRFVDAVRGICTYWIDDARVPDIRSKVEGAAFTILSMLDGGFGNMPGFLVAAQPHADDKEYLRSHGECWYPEKPTDIGGALHEHFYKR